MSAIKHQSTDCKRNPERGKENEGRVFGGRIKEQNRIKCIREHSRVCVTVINHHRRLINSRCALNSSKH